MTLFCLTKLNTQFINVVEPFWLSLRGPFKDFRLKVDIMDTCKFGFALMDGD